MGDNEDSHTALSQNVLSLHMDIHLRTYAVYVVYKASSEALYCTVHDDAYSNFTHEHTLMIVCINQCMHLCMYTYACQQAKLYTYCMMHITTYVHTLNICSQRWIQTHAYICTYMYIRVSNIRTYVVATDTQTHNHTQTHTHTHTHTPSSTSAEAPPSLATVCT